MSKVVSFQHVINIKQLLMRYFTFFWPHKVFEICCVFYTQSTSHFPLAVFQVFKEPGVASGYHTNPSK